MFPRAHGWGLIPDLEFKPRCEDWFWFFICRELSHWKFLSGNSSEQKWGTRWDLHGSICIFGGIHWCLSSREGIHAGWSSKVTFGLSIWPKFYTLRTPSWGYPDTIPSFILNRWRQNSGRVGFTCIAPAHTQSLHLCMKPWDHPKPSRIQLEGKESGRQWRGLRTHCRWGP